MRYRQPVYENEYYHIYNRGNNRENLFREQENYRYFLRLYSKYISGIAETFAYCLMPNHFHAVIRLRRLDESKFPRVASLAFGRLFGTYAKAFNKRNHRTGSLFEGRYKRKHIVNDRQLIATICYVHLNPVHHGFVEQPSQWTWSSYNVIANSKESKVAVDQVLKVFDDVEHFRLKHETGS